MSRKITSFALAIAVMIAFITCLMLAGCSESTKPKPRAKGCEGAGCLLPRTTPGNVLNNLRVYYSVMDNYLKTPEDAHSLARQYRGILHPDFKFYFIAGDAPPGLPEGWWGREPEVAAFDSLMTKRALGIITEIMLSWNVGPAVPDERMTSPPPPEAPVPLHSGWMHIAVNQILLDIVEGQNTREVKNGIADFYFAPDPADTTLWVITEWFDRQPVYSPPSRTSSVSLGWAPNASSWGMIKALYGR